MEREQHEGRRSVMSRRTFLRGLVVAGSAAVVAACGGNTAPEGGPAASAPGTAGGGGPVTIEWLNRYHTPVTQTLLPEIVSAFEAENPDIKVRYENPGSGEGYTEQILTRVAGGNPPDVATLFEPPVEFATRGALMELDTYMASATLATPDAFYPAPFRSCQWQGKTYGLPSSAGATAIFTNPAMLSARGISTSREGFPRTWDELKALDKEFIVIEGGEVKQAGFVPFIGSSWAYPVWSAINGGQIYDAANNQYTIDSDQNVEWVDYWLRWLDDNYGGDLEAMTIAANWASNYSDSAFYQGKAAMTFEGSWSCTDAEIPFEWDVVRLPVGPSGSTSYTAFYPNWWVVPNGSKQPEAAFRFIEFISTTGWTIWYRTIMDTPAWKQFPPTVITEKLVATIGEERAASVNAFFADYLNSAAEMWTSPVDTFATEQVSLAVEKVLRKQQSPREALAEAQQLAQAKLNEVLA